MPVPTPQHCPTPRELDDLEVLLSGALAPRTGFDDELTLDLPADLRDAPEVELVDPEGLPLARWSRDGLRALGTAAYGPFRRLHLTPAQVHDAHPDALLVPVDAALTADDLMTIDETREGRPVVLLALCGTGRPRGVSPVGLVRATLAAQRLLGTQAHVVACPLPTHDDETLDRELAETVAARYAPGAVLVPTGRGDLPAEVEAVVAQEAHTRGVVVLFTGLSGSGKSTLARALHDLLLEDGRHTVTSLDGDVVRRHLSAGLTFSRADRETNIRRIGWVAAEISRHGGVALCSPIAPFDETRQQVRAMVAEAGGDFVLVHVATPLEECERRDRKGLYAKARRGEIPDFTGISSPYEVPEDATVTVDTTGRTIEDCMEDLMPALPFDLSRPD